MISSPLLWIIHGDPNGRTDRDVAARMRNALDPVCSVGNGSGIPRIEPPEFGVTSRADNGMLKASAGDFKLDLVNVYLDSAKRHGCARHQPRIALQPCPIGRSHHSGCE